MNSDGAMGHLNEKNTSPSRNMLPPDGNRYRCPWIEDSITIHSDGNVTCGLDDPHGRRSFGNIEHQGIAEIFANGEYALLSDRLAEGRRCVSCSLYQKFDGADRAIDRPRLPRTLVVEPTVKCNLRCPNDACHANNDEKLKTRDRDLLSVSAFEKVVLELETILEKVYFFNYGDPFVHPKAEDMLAFLKLRCPKIDVVTSTNGIPLAKVARARKLVASRLDFIVFSIGGVFQESYEQYHVKGRVQQALAGLQNVVDAKREIGAQKPFVHWRYLLFNWNDSDQEIDEAFRLAKEMAVDDFTLYITYFPLGSTSYRFLPGSPNYSKYRSRISNALGCASVVMLQDRHGFYQAEEIGELGWARWTGWQARKVIWDCRLRTFSLSFTTNRCWIEAPYVLIKTPWIQLRLQLAHNKWRKIVLLIPEEYRSEEPVYVDILPSCCWFPADDLGSTDLRCLGVLVREDDDQSEGIDLDLLTLMTDEDDARLRDFTFQEPLPLVEDTSGRMSSFS